MRTVDRTGHRGWLAGLRVFALLIAGAIVPAAALAAESVMLPDGELLTVWESRQRFMISGTTGPATDGTSIAYSVSGIEGSFSGIVESTEDPAQDTWPRLVVDPESGWPRLVWSRYDGTSLRIAYARYEQDGWTDIRYLTYGPVNSMLPRIALGREGVYLFWVSWESASYMYAPLDLDEGQLRSYPRTLPNYAFPKPPVVDDGGDASATDAPVVTGDCFDGGCDSSGMLMDPGGSTSGAMDVPIVTGMEASIWTAGGSAACRSQILVIPNPGLWTASVIRFTHGSVSAIAIANVPSPTPESYGDTISRALLNSTCD